MHFIRAHVGLVRLQFFVSVWINHKPLLSSDIGGTAAGVQILLPPGKQ